MLTCYKVCVNCGAPAALCFITGESEEMQVTRRCLWITLPKKCLLRRLVHRGYIYRFVFGMNRIRFPVIVLPSVIKGSGGIPVRYETYFLKQGVFQSFCVLIKCGIVLWVKSMSCIKCLWRSAGRSWISSTVLIDSNSVMTSSKGLNKLCRCKRCRWERGVR